MIKAIRRLDFTCISCGEPAQVEVVRTNDELDPQHYVTAGERCLTYCWSCAPQDIHDLWNYHRDPFQ